jgi:hypothetical protein
MTDFLVDNKTLYNLQYNFLTYFSYIVKISLVLYIIGAFNTKSKLVLQINFIVKLFLGLFLVYRFSSRRIHKIHFTDLDRKIAFSAGLYIIVISFSDFLASITETTRTHVIKFLQPTKDMIFSNYKQLL